MSLLTAYKKLKILLDPKLSDKEAIEKAEKPEEKCWSPKRVTDVNLKDEENIKIEWGGINYLTITRKDNEIMIDRWYPVANGQDDFDWDFNELISFKI